MTSSKKKARPQYLAEGDAKISRDPATSAAASVDDVEEAQEYGRDVASRTISLTRMNQ